MAALRNALRAPTPAASSEDIPSELSCDHCTRRIRNSRIIVRTAHAIRGDADLGAMNFCGERRACRRAAHEAEDPMGAPPDTILELRTETVGAALTGVDYITWPWWLRWIPQRWTRHLRYEIAARVGGLVERRVDFVGVSLPLSLFAPWTSFLPTGDQREMLSELVDAIDPDARQALLTYWRNTALQLADEARRRVLVDNGFGTRDFVQAQRPEAVPQHACRAVVTG